jgi:hypothetical protein
MESRTTKDQPRGTSVVYHRGRDRLLYTVYYYNGPINENTSGMRTRLFFWGGGGGVRGGVDSARFTTTVGR